MLYNENKWQNHELQEIYKVKDFYDLKERTR